MPFDGRQCFCAGKCRSREAAVLNAKGETDKAYHAARRAVLQAPNCPYTHGMLAHILNGRNHATAAEHHIHIARELGDRPAESDCLLGWSYIGQSRIVDAKAAFTNALSVNAVHVPAHVGMAKVHEIEKDYEAALHSCERALAIDSNAAGVRPIYAKALTKLDRIGDAITILSGSPHAFDLFNLGKIYEDQGEYELAFNSYTTANQKAGKTYANEEAAKRIAAHKNFCTTTQLARLPRFAGRPGDPFTPVFVTGYPRSGTTLTETILSRHSQIQAGDELKFIWEIAGMSQAWLGASQPYPHSLRELEVGDKDAVAEGLRGYYFGGCDGFYDGVSTFVTDKMPLNEMHLPLISILFADAPVLYVRRHPLDIIFSNFANFLTHGFNQAFGLDTAALHYSRVDDLVMHYRSKLDIRFKEFRYEHLVNSPADQVKALLDFVGVDHEAACLNPEQNNRHARTPSYEAVKQPINDSAVGRWRNFARWVEPIAIPIVEHIIRREGY